MFNSANLKKTINYLKRNGLRDTYFAALERMQQNKENAYTYAAPDEEALAIQREKSKDSNIKFSILVPAYRTDEAYLRDMAESVLVQSYPNFELVIADAGEDNRIKDILKEYGDNRIKYFRLNENKGISENTNAALKEASGDYIGLLDHDDMLTPDALFEMAEAIKRAKEKGITLQLIYSDEDKCDEFRKHYYEPHSKTEFNLDLILSNNYICHFTVMKQELMKKLLFRKEYDGAQDYDLVLRGIKEIYDAYGKEKGLFTVEAEKEIFHIPKVLYHWRCHRGSTAENPGSKQYAYDAGGRAIADFLNKNAIKGEVSSTKHLGFYQVKYESDLLSARPDIGALGGCLYDRSNKITGGIYSRSGECPYKGLRAGFSGYMQRATLLQDAEAVDIRLMKIRPELFPHIVNILRKSMREDVLLLQHSDHRIDCNNLILSEDEYREISFIICKEIKKRGYRIVWDPSWTRKIDTAI